MPRNSTKQNLICGRPNRLAQNDPALLGQILTAQAYVARTRGDGRRAFELSQRALSLLPPDDDTSRSIVAMNLGMAYWYAGHLDGAQQMLSDARDAAHRSGNRVCRRHRSDLFVPHRGGARPAASGGGGLSTDSSKQSGPSPIAALAQIDLARLLYEWNDLEAAAQQAQRGIESQPARRQCGDRAGELPDAGVDQAGARRRGGGAGGVAGKRASGRATRPVAFGALA